jgi:DNA-binding response OmpR family regulator
MLVDDEVDLLEAMKLSLEGIFDRVDTCADGQQAFEQISKEKYDLIVSDIQMPHMKGDELLKNLRTKGIATPFVYVSGNGTYNAEKEASRLGAIAYVEKPFDFEVFLLEIRAIMEKLEIK